MKKRILVDGDTSTANSGFAVYKKKLMTALADCPHFEVAEIGSGGFMHDKEKVPWKYYPTSVLPSDERYREYSSDPRNEYGAWRFDKIVLHFRSDVYLGFSDPWQLAHAVSSVLRPYYHVMISPTVDSIPQRQDFLQIYAQADSIYTYTDWAADYLREKGLPCIGSIPMGIDPDVFKPIEDKGNHKQKYGIPADSIIFGFVARNQLRKRFPDIIESFAKYLQQVPEEIAKKSYLYLHTSHMDVGWDLVTHLLEQKVINKVLFTYFCRKTGEIFVSTFKGERVYSPYSNELSAFSPNVVQSPTEEQLNEVYNLFDYYLQPVTCEGFGVPTLEAAACNIPIMVTGYSAIKELAENFGGKCIEPGTLNYEHGVMARRASLDIQRWANGMVEFALNRPRINSREIVLQKYTWRHNFDKWINAIDRAGRKESWNSPIKQYGLPPLQGQMTATQFLYLLSNNIPQLRWSTMNLANIQSLNRMCELRGKQVMAINPQHIAQKYQNIISDINKYERIRVGLDKLELEDFLE